MVKSVMIPRLEHTSRIEQLLSEFPVVGLLGARQVGKSTLGRQLAAVASATWFDLERPRDLARLDEAELVLEQIEGLVVIDEVQIRPELFPLLRHLVDRPDRDHRYLVLGSAAPELLRQGSETLAGRIVYHVLDGFELGETGFEMWRQRWLRGGFPRSYVARTDAASLRWRRAFIETFLTRDLPALGHGTPAATMRRFWTMLAHWHGQTWNGAEFARAFGMSQPSVRGYLDTLAGTYLVRVVQPWFENLGKRQVRAPRVYIHDSGLLHALLGVTGNEALEGHPKIGASWEGFAFGAVARRLGARPEECFTWSTHQGAELDLLVVRGEERRGFEFKRTGTPRRTRSMAIAKRDLRLSQIDVIWPGAGCWPMGEGIRAVGIADLETAIPRLESG